MYEIFYRALGGKVQSKDGLSNVVNRREGGLANYGFGNPNFTTIAQPPGQMPIPQPPFPEPKPEPPPPPPEPPKPTYDPVREAEAERRARELQARKIAELGTAPQTRAEREALQAKGGFYRDEEGAVRDAMGNIQEDFGFDYVAPPEPGPYDPPDTPDTPAPEPEPEPFKLDTTPLPPGLVRNPETGEVTIDKELAKGYAHRGGWRFDDDIAKQQSDEEAYVDWDEQDYLRNVFMEGYEDTGLPRGQLGGGWTIERSGGREGYPNAPEMYNYALKGPEKTFLPTPMPFTPLPPVKDYYAQAPMQQGGLQSLPQGMGQGFNSQLFGRPAMQQQSMGQNLQPFGMQSPRPFGQKVY